MRVHFRALFIFFILAVVKTIVGKKLNFKFKIRKIYLQYSQNVIP